MNNYKRINIAITAMGGQGGGVLADWIVGMGEAAGWQVQSSSVPGVAQRTGATVYYLELFDGSQSPGEPAPVLSLSPASGDVDLVVAAELMEAGRAIQRQFVTPERTTLIASSHRAYAVSEKEALGNGIADSDAVHAAAREMARRYISFDMAAVAEQTGSVISAVLFGAIFGSGALPFPREAFEQAIREGGIGVDKSLAAFAAGALQAQGPDVVAADALATTAEGFSGWDYRGNDAGIQGLVEAVRRDFPDALTATVMEGVRRMLDHSDLRYARLYVERMLRLLALDYAHAGGDQTDWRFSREAASRLALWMAYEDTIRVADIKTRSRRFARLYQEVGINADKVSYFTEFLHPRLEEVAETLPTRLGRWVLRTSWAGRLLEMLFAGPKKLSTQSLAGFLSLYLVARMRPLRRYTLRDSLEQARINDWLQQLEETVSVDYALACELAVLPELIKGYSKTRERGLGSFNILSAAARALLGSLDRVDIMRQLKAAALESEQGTELSAALSRHHLTHLLQPQAGKFAVEAEGITPLPCGR
ncbi:indolepyruvate oxidoreductase subunit beta family protein [Zobellella maritima]|uniref:indolepyruvate oxidoreductase subunit beta family protein n=1 Tax=Zobellella maritima TaxID=2059725 RepID=UPI000E301B50|nr:indolepyruvate oxidoreductase subunit beta family protein [Zobellella maritima]